MDLDQVLNLHGPTKSAVISACEIGDSRSLEVLLEEGASVLVTDSDGNSGLHIAARRNDLAIATLLIRHGALIRAKDKAGRRPIDDLPSLVDIQNSHVEHLVAYLVHDAPKLDLPQHLKRLHKFAEHEETHGKLVELLTASDVQRIFRSLLTESSQSQSSSLTSPLNSTTSLTSLNSLASTSTETIHTHSPLALSFATYLATRPTGATIKEQHTPPVISYSPPNSQGLMQIGIAAAMAASSAGMIASPRAMTTASETKVEDIVQLILNLCTALISTPADVSVLCRGGFLMTVLSLLSLEAWSNIKRVIEIVFKLTQLDSDGDGTARAGRVLCRGFISHALHWHLLEEAEDKQRQEEQVTSHLAMVLIILERFSIYGGCQKDMINANLGSCLLKYCDEHIYSQAIADAAMTTVANLAENLESHLDISSASSLSNLLSVAINSSSKVMARESLRLASMMDIDTRLFGFGDRSLLLCELPENYLMFPSAPPKHHDSQDPHHLQSKSRDNRFGLSFMRVRDGSAEKKYRTLTTPSGEVINVPTMHSPSSSLKGAIFFNPAVSSSSDSFSSMEDNQPSAPAPAPIPVPEDSLEFSLSDLRGVNLLGLIHLLLQPDQLDHPFVTNVLSTLPSICSPLIFLRLILHCYRHKEDVDPKQQARVHSSSSTTQSSSTTAESDDSLVQTQDRNSEADVDEILGLYSDSASTSSSGRGKIPRIASKSSLTSLSDEKHDVELNTTQKRVVELIQLWMTIAQEDFHEPRLRRTMTLFIAEALHFRPNNAQLLHLHSGLLGTVNPLPYHATEDHSKFCNHNDVYIKARDAIISGQLPCQEEDMLFLAALGIHLETSIGVAFRLNIGTKLEGHLLIEAVKHFCFTIPLIPRTHQTNISQLRSRRKHINSFSLDEDESELGNMLPGIANSNGRTSTELKRDRFKHRIASRITEIYSRAIMNMSEKEAKHTYIDKCRSLRTYAHIFFPVKLLSSSLQAFQPYLFGINEQKLILVDAQSQVVRESFHIASLKTCQARDGLLLLRVVQQDEQTRRSLGSLLHRVLLTDSAQYLRRLIHRVEKMNRNVSTAAEIVKGFTLDLRLNRGCPPDPLTGDSLPGTFVNAPTPSSDEHVPSMGEGLSAVMQIGIGVSLPKVLSSVDALFFTAEFARQLTLIEQSLYCEISRRAVLSYVNRARDKENPNASSVKAVIAHFNHISDWVSTEVVKEENDSKRLALVRRFIQLGKLLFDLHNYNGVMEVISGLNSSPVRKLQMTWKALNKDDFATFKHLENVMASTGSFAEYRRNLAAASLPCLPYFGVYLTDLTFIEDGNPDNIGPRGLINLGKRKKVAEILDDIMRFQKKDFCFVPLAPFTDCIKSVQTLGEDERYALALHLAERVQ